MKKIKSRNFALPLFVSVMLLLFGVSNVSRVCAAESYDVTAAEFGANGSDTASDTVAFQIALKKAVGAKEMVTISVPAGNYYIDQPLRIYSNTCLSLAEGAVIHRSDLGIDRCMLHNVDQDGKMDAKGGYDMSQNIIVEGGVWDGGDTSKADDGADILRFDHAQNVQIRNCTIQNVYDCHLIELVGVKDGSVTNCQMSGFCYQKGKEDNYLYAREAIQLESAWTNDPSDLSPDSPDAWANGSVVDGTACQNITISGNTLTDLPCGVGQHHYTEDGKYRDDHVTIQDNIFSCQSGMKYCKTAVTCGGMNHVTIQNNTITGSYRFAVHVTEANDVQIKGNQISDSSYNGIMIDGGAGTVLEENKIQNIAKHGISVLGGTIEGISGNTVQNIKQDGIAIGKGTVKRIQGNTFRKVKKHAISIVGGTVGVGKKKTMGILKNTITDCGQNGVSISGGTVSIVKGNKISKIKNNGISIIKKAKVYFVTGNTLKNCKRHTIWSGSTRYKTVVKKNKA